MNQGPCLKHCYTCNPITTALSYLALIYMISHVLYCIIQLILPNPLRETLSPKQHEIELNYRTKTTQILLCGVIIGIIVLHVYQPFRYNFIRHS